MKTILNFFVKTFKGGIFFIIPITLILILCGKAIALLKPLANTISTYIDKDARSTFDLSYLIAILIFVILSFICGLIAASIVGKSIVNWIEKNILSLVPGYQMMKSSTEAIVGLENVDRFPVVLAPIDGWMITLLVDQLPNNEVAVYVP